MFLDLDRGSQSPAMRFWPRFQEIVDAEARKSRTLYDNYNREVKLHVGLIWRWSYLIKMEPVSTVGMYVDSWHKSPVDAEHLRGNPLTSTYIGQYQTYLSPFEELRRLPKAKRKEVVEALIREVERDASNLIGQSEKDDQNELQKRAIRTLRSLLVEKPQSEHSISFDEMR
jgi:hypothetical protein